MSAQAPCLFLSHSGADTEAARELKKRILSSPDAQQAGLRVWLDKDDLAPGLAWQAQLERAITEQATAFAVHVGASGIVNWVEGEVRLGLSRARSAQDFPFIPILARECSGTNLLPGFAREYHAVRDPLNNADELQKLVGAILRRSHDKSIVVLQDPFVGLKAMTEADSDRFFGRSEEVTDLVEKLKRHRLIAIVAESGAGKSSLAQAGLIPFFRGGKLAGTTGREPSDRLWHVVVMRPGRDPIEGLKQGITESAERLGRSGDQCAGLRKRIDPEDASETAYAVRCDLPPGRTETLLIVDQFEELLTETPEPKRAPFVDLLMNLAAADGFRIVLTLRADYLNLSRPLSNLFEHLSKNDQDCILRLRRITDKGIEEAVREPLRLAGHTDIAEQDAVIAAIRRDVLDRAGDLALVQMALYSMWQRFRSGGGNLLLAYNQVGGVSGALAHEAERVRSNELSATEQDSLLPIFARLVRLGETGGATRRTADLADFETARRALALKLATKDCGRLLLAGDTTVEVSHEALIMQWPWLQNVLHEAAGDMRVLDRLLDKTRRWKSEAQSSEHLATGAEREEFAALARQRQNWISAAESQFIDAGNQAYRRTYRRRVAAQVALGVFATCAVVLGIVAYIAYQRSDQAFQEASVARDRSLSTQSRFLADLARQNTDAGDAGAATLLALEGLPDISAGKTIPFVPEAEAALFKAQQEFREEILLKGHENSLWTADFAPDGQRLITASEDKTARLWDSRTGNQLAIFRGHTEPVRFAAFSPDGQLVTTTSGDRTARLWSLKTNNELAVFKGHTEEILRSAFSPEGDRLVTASVDHTARIWDARTGKEMFRLDRHTGPVRVAAFSADGRFIVTASDDSTARLWDARNGEFVRSFDGHTDAIRSAAFDSRARYLVTASLDKTARIWSVQDGAPMALLEGHRSAVTNAAFSPDGERVATASDDGTVGLSKVPLRAPAAAIDGVRTPLSVPVSFLDGHTEAVRRVQFSRDGSSLLTASDDGTARIWDVETARIKTVLKGHADAVRAAAFSPDGTHVLTASADQTARLWSIEPESRGPGGTLRGHSGPTTNASFSRDGRFVVTASKDRNAMIWDAQTRKQRAILRGHGAAVLSAAFSPNGRRIATGSADGTARIWDVQTGQELANVKSHGREVWSVVFSPDGARVGMASSEGSARLHEAETGNLITTFNGHKGNVYGIAFDSAGKRIVTTGEDRTTRSWDAEKGHQVASSTQLGDGHRAGMSYAAISPDTKLVVTVGGDDTPRLWDAGTGVLLNVLHGHRGSGIGAAFSSDNRRLATAADDDTVRIWDTKTGKTVAVLEGTGKARSVAFSEDGEWLVIASEDHGAQIWPIPSLEKLIERSKSRLSRCLTRLQREQAFLEPEPPHWCIAEKKWPYHTVERSSQISAGVDTR